MLASSGNQEGQILTSRKKKQRKDGCKAMTRKARWEKEKTGTAKKNCRNTEKGKKNFGITCAPNQGPAGGGLL